MTTDVPSSYNLYKHVNSKLGRQHRKAAMAAAVGPFFYELTVQPIQPVTDVTDMWRLATAPGSTSSTLFEQWFGFFFLPQELDKWSALFRPY